MAGKQLGALISLTQGLDMSPINSARTFDLQNRELQVNVQQALAAGNRDQQRIDLAREQGKDSLALSNRELSQREKLQKEEEVFREKEAARQRDLETALAKMQLTGRIDLQELIGAQEITQLNLQSNLSQEAQDKAFEFQRQQSEKLMTFEGDKWEKEFKQQVAESDRNYALAKARGDREAASAILDNDSKRLTMILAQRAADKEPTALEARITRNMQNKLLSLEIEKTKNNLEGSLSPVQMKKLNELQLELTQAEVDSTKAETEGTKVETAGLLAQLDEIGYTQDENGKLVKKEKSKEATQGGLLDEKDQADITNLQRLVDAESFGDTDIGFVTGNTLALNALSAIEQFAGNDEEVKQDRKFLRELAALGRKLNKGNVGGTLSDDEAVYGPPSLKGAFRTQEDAKKASGLSTKEQDRLLELIRHFKDRGVELVD